MPAIEQLTFTLTLSCTIFPAIDNCRPTSMPDRTYTISELAKEFGVTTRTIRFYEEKGLVSPLREGQKRLYTPADRVRIKLILRGKRIGMTLSECVEVIDMYQPGHGNEEQLHSLLRTVRERREKLLQQKTDIDDMLARLEEVRNLCEAALANHYPIDSRRRHRERSAP